MAEGSTTSSSTRVSAPAALFVGLPKPCIRPSAEPSILDSSREQPRSNLWSGQGLATLGSLGVHSTSEHDEFRTRGKFGGGKGWGFDVVLGPVTGCGGHACRDVVGVGAVSVLRRTMGFGSESGLRHRHHVWRWLGAPTAVTHPSWHRGIHPSVGTGVGEVLRKFGDMHLAAARAAPPSRAEQDPSEAQKQEMN